MTRTVDHPDIVIFPPLVLLATFALAIALQWAWPLGAIAQFDQGWRIATGIVLVGAGAAVTISGRLALMRGGTNVNPLQPTTAFITNGIYQWTRNRMYTGVVPAMVGVSLVFGLDWLIILILPSYCVLHVTVVRREEEYLERKFGEAYRHYAARVPRYAGLPKQAAPAISTSQSSS
ncbi:MAG: methyltransferase family protein [Xanthobacteraceae bacterium]